MLSNARRRRNRGVAPQIQRMILVILISDEDIKSAGANGRCIDNPSTSPKPNSATEIPGNIAFGVKTRGDRLASNPDGGGTRNDRFQNLWRKDDVTLGWKHVGERVISGTDVGYSPENSARHQANLPTKSSDWCFIHRNSHFWFLLPF